MSHNRRKILTPENYADITQNTNEIRDKCRLYLAYLMEEGFRIEVRYLRDYFYEIGFYGKQDLSNSRKGTIPFEWGEIKLDFIPFISAINSEYNIAGNDVSFDSRDILVTRVLDDMIINHLKTEYIKLLINIE